VGQKVPGILARVGVVKAVASVRQQTVLRKTKKVSSVLPADKRLYQTARMAEDIQQAQENDGKINPLPINVK